MTQDPKPPARKPRLALMGEFSAGKSTLANFLLGQAASPVQVTATQLPPVWYSHGPDGARRIPKEGPEVVLDPADWNAVGPDDTKMIRVSMPAPVLEACDLIDMPGTSDPNMAADIWSDLLPETDLIVWCTPANQAWRQSEAALWAQVPERLQAVSLLLITRIDQMRSDRDRARVLQRVKLETDGAFRSVLSIALPDAIAHREDVSGLMRSGGGKLAASLLETIESLGGYDRLDGLRALAPVAPASAPDTRLPDAPEPPGAVPKVMPRRIKRKVVPPGGAGHEIRPG